MPTMTRRAIGHPQVSPLRRHSVVSVHVTLQSSCGEAKFGHNPFRLMTAGTGFCHSSPKHRRTGIFRGSNGVFAMTIRTDRGFFDPMGAGLAVNALFINGENVGVASPTGFRNMGPVHAAGRIGRTVKVVGSMAVRTYRGIGSPRTKRNPVDRAVIGFHRFSLGQKIVYRCVGFPMAGRAGIVNVFSVHGRCGVPRI